ncbi:MAG TPA: glycerol-3-phosphate acyltransferase [Candidatus Limnocylindrales bacterium]|nr:glycerol-3-phosphate acyltransferase [Candidatus Limnocylindrales bacterium]
MDLPSTLLAAGLVGLGYLSGSIPFGVILARLSGRRDPRSVGSGRTGGANAMRALGWAGGLAVGLLDIAKGAFPVLVARAVTSGSVPGGGPLVGALPLVGGAPLLGAAPVVEALTAIAAVAGANRSIFLRFHGGRGVATGIGAMLVIDWRVIAVAAPVFLGVIAVTRYVSLGSLLGTAAGMLALVLFVVAGGTDPVYLVYGLAGGLLIWLAHADNIERLLNGTERRFTISQDEGRDDV